MQRPDWIKPCKQCTEPTGHKLDCCLTYVCNACQNSLNAQFQPFLNCPWCNKEILPLDVKIAKRDIPYYIEKLKIVQNRIDECKNVIALFEDARFEFKVATKEQILANLAENNDDVLQIKKD